MDERHDAPRFLRRIGDETRTRQRRTYLGCATMIVRFLGKAAYVALQISRHWVTVSITASVAVDVEVLTLFDDMRRWLTRIRQCEVTPKDVRRLMSVP